MAKIEEFTVSDPGQLASLCDHLGSCQVIGFDTEFVGEDSYHPELCLLQIATQERLAIVDPFTAGALDPLWEILVSPKRTVVVHAGREEARLCRRWSGRPPEGIFDLQIAAGLQGRAYPLSHGNLVQQLLGIQLTKGETLTEWRNRPLSEQQIRYAFDDVRHLLAAWQVLHRRLDALGRLSWAQEEFRRLTNHVVAAADRTEKWRKLRGLGSFDRRRLAVARELIQWRDQVAADEDRPPRTVLRDDLIVEIARRMPRQEVELRSMRGLARRFVQPLLKAVLRGMEIPINDCPAAFEREAEIVQVPLLISILSAVLDNHCVRHDLASSLVATKDDLKTLVRSFVLRKAVPEDLQLAQGWRRDHILPHLEAVLQGRCSLRIGNVQVPDPLVLSESVRKGV